MDNILVGGYDIEARRNKYGITVASVAKQVKYRGNDEKL